MPFTQKLKRTLTPSSEQETVPDKEQLEETLEKGGVDNKKEMSRALEMLFMQSFMAGEKNAEIQGTKRDKLFMLVMINLIMTGLLTTTFLAFKFVL